MSAWQSILSQISTTPLSEETACCIPLAHLACVDIDGAQTDGLLQGQLTCDLKTLDSLHWTPGAHCTPKGRMISNFQLHRTASGCRLILSDDLATTQSQALAKYSPLYRGEAQVSDRSSDLLGIGLIGSDALSQLITLGFTLPEPGEQLTQNNCTLLRLTDEQRVMLWAPIDDALNLWQQLSQTLTTALPARWQLAEIQQGRALVCASTSDRFIPQQLNLSIIGGVSFNKGCYTGQEIVARLQYRGKQKNHLHRISTEGPLPETGTTLIREDTNEEAGELINCAQLSDGTFEALALIRDSDLEKSPICLSGADGKRVKRLEFPYTVEND